MIIKSVKNEIENKVIIKAL